MTRFTSGRGNPLANAWNMIEGLEKGTGPCGRNEVEYALDAIRKEFIEGGVAAVSVLPVRLNAGLEKKLAEVALKYI